MRQPVYAFTADNNKLRVREQIHMDNPQLDTIQREYPQLWRQHAPHVIPLEM